MIPEGNLFLQFSVHNPEVVLKMLVFAIAVLVLMYYATRFIVRISGCVFSGRDEGD
ncbi:MAG: hypothetical protein QXT27_05015 [Pyrobaculum sp.]